MYFSERDNTLSWT